MAGGFRRLAAAAVGPGTSRGPAGRTAPPRRVASIPAAAEARCSSKVSAALEEAVGGGWTASSDDGSEDRAAGLGRAAGEPRGGSKGEAALLLLAEGASQGIG